jgi:hypothetical protein
MKKNVLILIAVITYSVNLFAQIGTHIPSTRLPAYEQSWWDSTEMVLPWQNAGCLKQIEANHSLPKHIIKCASEEGEILKN